MRSSKFSFMTSNTLVLRWGRAPSCMNLILSKSYILDNKDGIIFQNLYIPFSIPRAVNEYCTDYSVTGHCIPHSYPLSVERRNTDFSPLNTPILLIDELIQMKVGFVTKPNYIHIKVLFVNSVGNSVGETQQLFHGPGICWLMGLNFVWEEI
ncbi:hypothetical protein TNCV_4734271 [Trichonephila clavipes]|nr:hypothetical protein TNCV_4734271 [Trichonephila clavipes]